MWVYVNMKTEKSRAWKIKRSEILTTACVLFHSFADVEEKNQWLGKIHRSQEMFLKSDVLF